jgi:hypothetical protein
MSTRPTDRRRKGFGAACLSALALPAIVMVGSLGLSYQSSTARRFTSSVWMSYLGLELAEAAVAEASHVLTPADLFDPQLFGEVSRSKDPAKTLLTAMVADKLPAEISTREYRDVLDESGGLACRMLTAFMFPRSVKPRIVKVPGLALALAKRNPGVLTESPEDLQVVCRPLSFRREYYSNVGGWVNWGVVQFVVTVRTRELKGISAHRLLVDRRFTLESDPKPGEEMLKVSSQNLRTSIAQEDR